MGKRILILGAGFGGLACANTLRKNLGQEHRIIIIDRKKSFMMGLVKLWVLNGTRNLEESQTPLSSLNAKGIEYLNDEITKIEVAKKRVQVKGHGWLEYDYLVVALGTELAPERVEGFEGRGFNLYDSKQVPGLREKLLALRKGKVAISIMGAPYKCPPAPYEAAMMISDMLENNGTRKAIDLEVFAPSPIALPVAGPKVSADVVEMIGKFGIKFSPNCKPKVVRDGEVEFENGRREKFDVLIGIPQHRAPDVIKSSGLAAEWIAVDRETLRTQFENVFAIGDVTEIKMGQLAMPKAGIFAEGEAKVVAQEITDEIAGQKPQAAYNGQGYCYVEAGNRTAGYVEADFYNSAGPAFKLDAPAEKYFEKKHEFERSRLKEWLL
ncbi:FAD/NAD(P)-binding oxidoreductase [Nitrososphaera sp.]|uniref:NAD(P)/FAD-dependent oxidoreductase n=1 Tax=Nitrososphaera sp. TaxID=1971748 RepID=UPI0017D14364|nr:FAD/NAD(P)-binding oxidoreductase [Nitrososphaera sp.]NWG36412.1 NAD(P)/FAD-dependent oxidoreductase [Nitrososphaera sp.]